jgi:methylenetetrahydrofolate dehydrogenase (NADP+) / methenyltetrahydrofolate cyclohydrolase
VVATLINGKEVAKQFRSNLKERVEQLVESTQITPHLVVILVGDNPASLSYIKGKQQGCAQVNMKSSLINLPSDTSEEELITVIHQLNEDASVHGILVQLPLPKQINELTIINQIDVRKDVDGFSPVNVGRMMIGEDCLLPCTPVGIIELIKSTGTTLSGKHAVVIGRSNIVGKPVSQLLIKENATVTVCHSKTHDLNYFTKQADLLIVAMGKPKFITRDMVKEGAIVIDVGTTRGEDGKFYGDVDFDEVIKKASFITPVPGGVGPMTITMLLENTFKAYKNQLPNNQ